MMTVMMKVTGKVTKNIINNTFPTPEVGAGVEVTVVTATIVIIIMITRDMAKETTVAMIPEATTVIIITDIIAEEINMWKTYNVTKMTTCRLDHESIEQMTSMTTIEETETIIIVTTMTTSILLAKVNQRQRRLKVMA
jgi:hypothetical protein